MKKVISVIIVIAIFMIPVLSAQADNALDKLGRGAANVITSPFEISKNMGDAKEESGIFASLTTGLLKGIFDFGKRAVVGVYEIVTFPVPVPADYKPILTDPEYFLDGYLTNDK